MIAVIGSGFGLYGYLPALALGCGVDVGLPERYRSRLAGRTELAPCRHRVRWFADELAAVAASDGALLAVRPADQPVWAARCLAFPAVRTLLLEKPMAATPAQSGALLDALADSGKAFRVNYSFAHLAWRDRLASAVQVSERVQIRWRFAAHHFRTGADTWKRRHSQGGGVLRFYGIHLVALAAALGYVEVTDSALTGQRPDEPDRWVARLRGPGLAVCDVLVESRSEATEFAIVSDRDDPVVTLLDPFDQDAVRVVQPPLDRRVAVLTDVCRDVLDQVPQARPWLQGTIRLWQRIENAASTQTISTQTISS